MRIPGHDKIVDLFHKAKILRRDCARDARETLYEAGYIGPRKYRIKKPPLNNVQPYQNAIAGDLFVLEAEGMTYRYCGKGTWQSMLTHPGRVGDYGQ